MTPDRSKTIEDYHTALSDGDREICRTLKGLIDAHLDGAQSKIWHAHPVWFIDGNPIVGYSKLKSAVRLLFWSGQSFASPGLTPEGSFKAAEVRYTDSGQIDGELLGRWLAEAKTTQWDYKNLMKKRKLERIV